MEGTRVCRAVAETRHDNVVFVFKLKRQGLARSNGNTATHDAAATKHACFAVEDDHVAGPAAAIAFVFAKNFTTQAFQVQSFGNVMGMSAVGGCNDIVLLEGSTGSHTRSLLAETQMKRAKSVTGLGFGYQRLFQKSGQKHPIVYGFVDICFLHFILLGMMYEIPYRFFLIPPA
jgi:hypothetical protein